MRPSKRWDEVTGPIIAITLVLMAVFLPTAFLPGVTGELYRQFALTIAATAFISAINAVTLKPAQCARFLRPPGRKIFLARAFNFFYDRIEGVYGWITRQLLKVWWLVLLVFVGIAVLTWLWYTSLPAGFLPAEDQGYIILPVQLPDGASLERTSKVILRINKILEETPGVNSWFVLGGFSLLDGTAASNSATVFIGWNDWSLRKTADLQQEALVQQIRAKVSEIEEAIIFPIVPPSIQGLGVAGGFQMQVEDREGVGLEELQTRLQEILAAAKEQPEIATAASTFRSGVPQYYLDINREKAEKMGIPVDEIFRTLQTNLGSTYVNDFNKFGRTFQVRLQSDASFRTSPEIIERLEVRNRNGQMVSTRHSVNREGTDRPAVDHALQSLPDRDHQRQTPPTAPVPAKPCR
jgi:hydrophobic/amphiphilic exporter-1 (mainly G- bacteria), HAE1 family